MATRWTGPRLAMLTALSAVAACSSSPHTPRLDKWDLLKGYRFTPEDLPQPETPRLSETNSDELFVILAFSGGGTRAAALSLGVLEELDGIEFNWNIETNEPCGPSQCPDSKRTLLDEVDVISSVSGGSFTSAYYALMGRDIFDPASPFQKDFLYHPVQRDLFAQTIHYPGNWGRIKSRIEVAAAYYSDHIFGDSTYRALERRGRPFVILNSTDVSKGARFEFTQRQFDLLCADLSQFPIARAVAASSAFPGLLTSMTVDSYATHGCEYEGPGSGRPLDWVNGVLENRNQYSPPHYRQAREIREYADTTRQHLHVIDGGVVDNIGVEPINQALLTLDMPVQMINGRRFARGLSVLTMLNRGDVKHVIVIIVNAKTSTTNTWDADRKGPGTFAVLNRAVGIPIGLLTEERPGLMTDFALFNEEANQLGDSVSFSAFELAFNDIKDPEEREFFNNLGTNFELAPFEVRCLIDRGGLLLRGDSSFTGTEPVTFDSIIRRVLKAEPPPPPDATLGRECTQRQAKERIGTRTHHIDVGINYSVPVATHDIAQLKGRPGLSLRLVRPKGFGFLLNVERQSFEINDGVAGLSPQYLGDLNLWTFALGAGYSQHWGPIEWTAGVTGGFGLGGFELTNRARGNLARDLDLLAPHGKVTRKWLVQPQTKVWYNVSNGFALTGFARYVLARPMLSIVDDGVFYSRRVNASGLRLGFGVGKKVF